MYIPKPDPIAIIRKQYAQTSNLLKRLSKNAQLSQEEGSSGEPAIDQDYVNTHLVYNENQFEYYDHDLITSQDYNHGYLAGYYTGYNTMAIYYRQTMQVV